MSPGRGRPVLFLFLLLHCIGLAPAFAQDGGEAAYQEALALSRSGDAQAAIPRFATLVREYPNNPRYRYDYIAVLGWAERNDEVLQLAADVNLAVAPPYVLETLGKSARNSRRYGEAVTYYRAAQQRDPQRLASSLGLAYALAENGQSEAALQVIEPLRRRHPDNVDVLEAEAFARNAKQDYVGALRTYDDILRLNSQHKQARRGRVLATARIGAPHQAWRMAQAEPGLLTQQELEFVRAERNAVGIRWGQAVTAPVAVTPNTDAAIEDLRVQIAALGDASGAQSLRLNGDLLVALGQRKRSAEVIALYEGLGDGRSALRDDVLLSVADAYLAQRKPEPTRDLYRGLLERNPANFDAGLGLFYALMDLGEYQAALSHIDALAAAQSPWVGRGTGQENGRKLDADAAAALARAWTDDLKGAQQRFEGLSAAAPANPELHTELGYVYWRRGWPRRALDEFTVARTLAEGRLGPRLGQAEVGLELQEYRQTEDRIGALRAAFPGERGVLNLTRSWARHNKRWLHVDVSTASSTGSQFGTDNLTLDAYLYSQPLSYDYRVFGHAHYATAEFPEGDTSYERYGVGADYRIRDWTFMGEISAGPSPYSDPGLTLRADWMPSDHWAWGLYLDSYSNDIPLRGRLNEDVEGAAVGVTGRYLVHESRSVYAEVQYTDMSDGNQRIAGSLTLFQRLLTRARYKLDSWWSLYGSTNSREDASYFNPRSDFSPTVTVVNDWMLYQRYEFRFVHRLGLSAGLYDQDGFGSAPLWRIHYEHDWQFNDALSLRYGIARSAHPYDGVTEHENSLYGTLDWRF